MEISYEDDAGNVTTTEKTITLLVSEENYDDMMYDDMMYDDMEEDGGGSGKGAAIAVVIVIVIIIAGVIIFLKLRKKKKAEKALQDDLADLEGDIEEERNENSQEKPDGDTTE
jgi:uncharacterized spore protein YtfJ